MMHLRDISPPIGQTSPRVPRKKHSPSNRGLMAFFGVVVILFFIALAVVREGLYFQQELTARVRHGISSLATKSFTDAEDAFASSELLLGFLRTSGSPTVLKDGMAAIQLAQEATQALKALSSAISNAREPAKKLLTFPISDNGPSLTQPLRDLVNASEPIFPLFEKITIALDDIQKRPLPLSMQKKLHIADETLQTMRARLTLLHTDALALLNLFGDRHPQNFLFVFQNNAERRPTGGFIGSLGLFTMNDGYRTDISVRDVYDFDGQLAKAIPAPDEVRQLTSEWQLRDSNVSPDFSISALNIQWFFEKEGGGTVDHVIAITPDVLERVLDVTGPITLSSTPFPLESKNVSLTLTALVEAKAVSSTQPKIVLSSLMAALEKKFSEDPAIMKNIMELIPSLLQEKHILLWSKNENVQAFFEKFGGTGRIKNIPAGEDYFSVVTTSIGGNKSDAYMKDTVRHTTFLKENGIVMDEVKIFRHHTWDATALRATRKLFADIGLPAPSNTLLDIMGAGANQSFVRVYVPLGAELEYVSGVRPDLVEVQTDEALGKTFFRYFSEVLAGVGQTVTLRYRLPTQLQNDVSEYRLHVQKQPGTPGLTFKKDIVNDERRVVELFPNDIPWKRASDRAQTEIFLDRDTMFAGLFQG